MEYIEEAERLRQLGHRLTPQRLQVLQVIQMHADHVSAEEIHAAIVPQQPYLSIATVYRTLQWLQSLGLVVPISLGGGRQCYEYRPPGTHHHHLICQRCGQVTQLPDETFATLKADIEQRYCFTLHVEHLVLPGRCAACRVEEATN